jgi:hypothetical protein
LFFSMKQLENPWTSCRCCFKNQWTDGIRGAGWFQGRILPTSRSGVWAGPQILGKLESSTIPCSAILTHRYSHESCHAASCKFYRNECVGVRPQATKDDHVNHVTRNHW